MPIDPLESFVFSDFRGGLNTKASPFELEDNEAQDLLNVTLTQRGALMKRPGKTRFDASGFPVDPARANHLRSWYPGDSKFLMASINGDLYSFTALGVGTQRVNGTDATTWCMEQMMNASGAEKLWACNGVDTPRVISADQSVANWVLAPAPNPILCRVWRNRMVVVGASSLRLWISNIGDPTTFPATNFIDVKGSEEDNESVTWLEVLGDDLIVFKENALWSVYAEPPNIATRRVGQPGCNSRFQTCVVQDRAYYWSRNGVWSTDGTDAPVYESEAIENLIIDHHDFTKAPNVRLASSRDRRVFVALAMDANSGNNTLLEMVTDINLRQLEVPQDQQQQSLYGDISRSPWLKHDLPVAGMCTFRPVEKDVLIAGAANASRLHELFRGTQDDGVAVKCHWHASWKALYGQEPLERLRRLNFQMDGVADVEVYTDFGMTPVFQARLERAGAGDDPLWDGGSWDVGAWDEMGSVGFLRTRPETRGRYHSIKVKNSDPTRPMLILLIEMMVRGSKELHT
jgi:hypothetical protein